MNINGSVVFVTGANRGLGLAFVKGLQAAGARKIYAGVRDPNIFDVPGVHPIKLDITNAEQVLAAAREASDTNVLINNAGIMVPSGFLGENGVAASRHHFETNFFGTLAMAQAFAPVLQKNGGGALVNVLSVLSWLNIPTIGAYCASKAAAWSLTNGLRNELRANQTLVVGVHAAYIDTDMAKQVQAPKTKPEEVVRLTLEAIESGREEVLSDEITHKVKGELNAELPVYVREWGK
ncbi:SDR family oxidoreductase [Paraherbaspirillum soli]|uniref:SDR family oxidoreductase n=1 Tax=Paraherbaspirillum soli TaxID=631222 RepID=A0ABW0M494_9BURK